MNETICNVMLFGGIALAVVFAVIAVILFVKLDIPKVIGDLSGSTARKQIKEIREKGYESLQGSGASKKDAIKSKGSTSKIEVRDIKGKSASEEVSRKGNERYKKAVDELNKSRSHHHTRPEEADSEMPGAYQNSDVVKHRRLSVSQIADVLRIHMPNTTIIMAAAPMRAGMYRSTLPLIMQANIVMKLSLIHI